MRDDMKRYILRIFRMQLAFMLFRETIMLNKNKMRTIKFENSVLVEKHDKMKTQFQVEETNLRTQTRMLKDLQETNKQLISNIHDLTCVKTDMDLKLQWEMKVNNQLEIERKDYYRSWKKMKKEALANFDKVEEYMINYQHEKENRVSITS